RRRKIVAHSGRGGVRLGNHSVLKHLSREGALNCSWRPTARARELRAEWFPHRTPLGLPTFARVNPVSWTGFDSRTQGASARGVGYSCRAQFSSGGGGCEEQPSGILPARGV